MGAQFSRSGGFMRKLDGVEREAKMHAASLVACC